MEKHWELEDMLSNVCTDLLSFKKFEPFLRLLFASPPGTWHKVSECCGSLTELPRYSEKLFSEHADALVVTYLPWPEPYTGGYALVLFVHYGELWSTTAAYNRERLAERQA